MKNVLLATLTGFVVSGCAHVPTDEPFPAILKTSIEPESADAQALAYADSVLRERMADSGTALELIPEAYGIRDCYARGGVEYKVWASAVRTDTKEFYGGYDGFKTFLVYFVEGEPVAWGQVEGTFHQYGTYLCPDALLQKIR